MCHINTNNNKPRVPHLINIWKILKKAHAIDFIDFPWIREIQDFIDLPYI